MKIKMPSFKIYRLWYLFGGAILFTLLLRGWATHPGMILGWVSLFTGGMLIYEVSNGPREARMSGIFLVVIIELIAIIVVNTDNDPLEIWVGVVYGVLSTVLIGLRVLAALRDFR
jgi:hypothetical protein